MKADEILNKISLITKGDDMQRITVQVDSKTGITIFVDLHRMNRKEANRFIKNIIAINQFSFSLVLIHGFNHGTVLKEMIWDEMLSNRITTKYCPEENPGRTNIKIAA